MRKLIIFLVVIWCFAMPVSAAEVTAPEVPESGRELMPDEPETFAEGVLEILREAIAVIRPDLAEAAATCTGVAAAVLLASMLRSFPGITQKTIEMAGTVCVASILLLGTNSLIALGAETVTELSHYGKLLLPVMTAALASQGGITTSASLYTATAAFNALLTALISDVLIPMIYVFLALAAANSAIGEEALKKAGDFVKWVMSWSLKTILYIFTGYMGITGIVSGTTDAATLKATKLTISGMVPVVGGILSDASEAVLVGAGTVKNAAGIYGILAVLAVCVVPFLKIGIHYLLLKATSGVCGVFGCKRITDLIGDFSGAMGMLLAMTGSESLLILISTVCFLKGVG